MEYTTRYKCHLTENHQLQAADALIKKLKQELGAANAYIEELEEEREPKYQELKQEVLDIKSENEELSKRNAKLLQLSDGYQKIVNKLTAKYSQDLTVLKQEPIIEELSRKHEEEIEYYKNQVSLLSRQRDSLLTELIKLRNGQ